MHLQQLGEMLHAVTLDSISSPERSANALRQLFKQNRKFAEAIYDRNELTI